MKRAKLGKKGQVHMCGNAVSPPMAEALLVPNYAECVGAEMEAIA